MGRPRFAMLLLLAVHDREGSRDALTAVNELYRTGSCTILRRLCQIQLPDIKQAICRDSGLIALSIDLILLYTPDSQQKIQMLLCRDGCKDCFQGIFVGVFGAHSPPHSRLLSFYFGLSKAWHQRAHWAFNSRRLHVREPIVPDSQNSRGEGSRRPFNFSISPTREGTVMCTTVQLRQELTSHLLSLKRYIMAPYTSFQILQSHGNLIYIPLHLCSASLIRDQIRFQRGLVQKQIQTLLEVPVAPRLGKICFSSKHMGRGVPCSLGRPMSSIKTR